MNANIVVESIRSVKSYLTARQKQESISMFLLLILASLMDVFGLASLVPVMMSASEPGSVYKSKILLPLYQVLNFDSERMFFVCLILFIFLFFILKNFFTTWINYKQAKFGAAIALNIVQKQFNKYSNLPFWLFNNIGSATIINSISAIPALFVNGIIRPLFIIFSEVAIVLVVVVGILIYKPILFLILVIVLVPSGLLTYKLLKDKSQEIGNRFNKLRPEAYNLISDSFIGHVEIKLAGKQEIFKNKLIKIQRELLHLDAISYLFTMIPLKVIELVAILGVVTIFLYSLLLSDDPGNLITIVGLFAAAAYRLMPSINRLLVSFVSLKQFHYTIIDLNQYKEFDITSSAHRLQSSLSFKNEIQLEKLTFNFPQDDKPAISDINLSIKKGERLGFIGSSGSGKTTLMNIILRFYIESGGSIKVDGIKLNESHIDSWHRIIGYVKQDTFLMEASIKDNITLGEENVDLDRLEMAIDQASLTEFIESLPSGFETYIGERGSKLSGGQRQRIGIARALYKRTEILIFDEATSALDNETEREVNEAISKLSQTEITILIIAHRITTLRDCNRIFELRKGRIVNVHQYDDLIKKVI